MRRLFSKIATLSVGLAMAVGVGVAVNANKTKMAVASDSVSTLTFTAACGGSGTANDGATWTITSNAEESTFDNDRGIHYGTNKKSVRYLQAASSSFTAGIISKVEVECAGSGNPTLTCTVGGEDLDDAKSNITSTNTKYTFTGSKDAGNIVVKLDKGSSSTGALYFKSIAVTYNATATYAVTYYGNGNESGTVPTDPTEYNSGDEVTVLGNTGSLKKIRYVFSCWNTKADGTGTDYNPGAKFEITKQTNLYAKWVSDSVDHISVSGSMTKTSYKEGQEWNPAGFTVNAYFTDNISTPVDVTSEPGVTWTYSPSKATDTSVTSVTATAHYSGKEASSEAQTVTVVEDNAVVCCYVDELDRELTGITDGSTSYSSWSGKKSNSSAVYAGTSAGSKNSIQIRSKDSDSGVITTASGGKVRKVVIDWQSDTISGRTLDVYGKNTAYSKATDLYDAGTQGTNLGSIAKGTSTELVIEGDYEYVGIRSQSEAMYLSKITIYWEKEAAAEDISVANAFVSANMHLDYTKNEGLCTTWYSAAKTAFAAITNENAKAILLTSNSKYAKVTLDPNHKKDGDPETIVYTYRDVRERLAAWAEANGEIFNVEDGTFTPATKLVVDKYIGGSTANYAIIIIVATVSITALGVALMVLKKKKHN